MPKKKYILVLVPLLVTAGVIGYFFWSRTRTPENLLTLYGDIDIRQVQTALDDNGRLLDLKVQEGDRVRKGQLLAEIDPVRFRDAVDRDIANVAAQKQVLARLRAGSRPEEIAEARAEVAAAQATLSNAEVTWRRQQALAVRRYVPEQSLDNAATALKTTRANLDHAQQALTLAIKGPRQEEIAAARHQLQADKATLALARRALADTRLYAPEGGVIQDRILEPGDMVSPQTPVFTLALDNPVWVRAYLPEKALGRIRPGMKATIDSDSFPDRRFTGWVGFISPTAEFTPKTVQTTELRTELVYRVRVYACNPGHRLRLGMPVTVQIPLLHNPPQNPPTHPCGN